jgi:hypothetical protein
MEKAPLREPDTKPDLAGPRDSNDPSREAALIHPQFEDRPELDPVAWRMMAILHSHVPPEKLPKSWSDYSPEQVLRAKEAAASVYDAAAAVLAVAFLDAPQGELQVDDLEIARNHIHAVVKLVQALPIRSVGDDAVRKSLRFFLRFYPASPIRRLWP